MRTRLRLLVVLLLCTSPVGSQTLPPKQATAVFVTVVTQMPWYGPLPWLPDALGKSTLECGGKIAFKQRNFKAPGGYFTCELPERPRLLRRSEERAFVRSRVWELLRPAGDITLVDSPRRADVVLWVHLAPAGAIEASQRRQLKLEPVRDGDHLIGAFALAVPPAAYQQNSYDFEALRQAALWEERALGNAEEAASLPGLLDCFLQTLRKRAQRPSAEAAFSLRLDTNLVMVPVTVRDSAGRFVTDLIKDDFRVAENDAEEQLALFHPVEEQLDVALILGNTTLMASRLDESKRAALAFIEKLRPQDRVLVVSSNHYACVESELTADRQQTRRAIADLKQGSGYDPWQAVELTLAQRFNRLPGRKAVVLFTDGGGGESSFGGSGPTPWQLEAANTPVYVIYYNTETEAETRLKQNDPRALPSAFESLRKSYRQATAFFSDVANASNGRLYRAEELAADDFPRIAEEIRSQY